MCRLRLKLTGWTLVALTAAVSLVAMAAGGGAQAPPTSYAGSAYAIGFSGVTVGGRAIPDETLGATGTLPASGGTTGAPAGTLTLPDAMGTLTVTDATLNAGSGTASATYKVSQVSLLPALTKADVETLCLPLLACVPNLVAGKGGPVQLLDITLVQSTASTSTTNPAHHAQSTQIGAITLLGGSVEIPLSATPDSTVNLGLFSITLHQQAYDATTDTASAQAVVLYFPPNGRLSPAITGTITIASTSVSATALLARRTLG